MDPIFVAVEFAARAHAGQYRKRTTIPYIVHPLAVAKLLIEYDFPQDVVLAGVLHDTVEDTAVTVDEIRTAFGNEVAALVSAVTEPPRTFSWEERKRAILEQMETAALPVLALECADKLDNLRDIQAHSARDGDMVWERFNRPKLYQHWYYASIAQIFLRRISETDDSLLFRDFIDSVQTVFGSLTPPSI